MFSMSQEMKGVISKHLLQHEVRIQKGYVYPTWHSMLGGKLYTLHRRFYKNFILYKHSLEMQ